MPAFIGVGVGPGDPELITLKAARHIQDADVLSFLTNAKGESLAKTIASGVLKDSNVTEEIPLLMPMSKDRSAAHRVYDEASEKILSAIACGKKVVFLCEGDPLFFGSFAYILERLKDRVSCAVVPGITSIQAASSLLKTPLAMQGESFAVVSGRHSQERIESALNNNDSVAIMKAGRSRNRIIESLKTTNRSHEAAYLECISQKEESVTRNIEQLSDGEGPYFSLFLVTKTKREQG